MYQAIVIEMFFEMIISKLLSLIFLKMSILYWFSSSQVNQSIAIFFNSLKQFSSSKWKMISILMKSFD